MQNRQFYADSAPTSLLAVVHLIHDSFFSDVRLRCEIAHLLGHVSHGFMAEEGTINVLFYTAKRLKEEETPVMENFLLFFQSADRMSP